MSCYTPEKQERSEAEGMGRIYAVLALILVIPIFAYAQDEAALLENWDDLDYYLLSEEMPDWELWDQDSDWEFYIDIDVFCDIFLDTCLDLELADEDIYA